MDNNNTPVQPTPVQPNAAPDPAATNPVVPNPAAPNPAQPVPPQPVAPQAPNTEPEKGSNKILMWFIIGIVIVVVLVGGFYLYLSRQQAVNSGKQAVATQTPAPVQENLEDELNKIAIDDAESDFAALDADLQQL